MIVHVISPGWQCGQWVRMHCTSVDMQQGDIKINHVLVDDGGWGARDFLFGLLIGRSNRNVRTNTQRMGGLYSRWKWCTPADEDLVVMLDMDDWLIHPRALDIMAKAAETTGAWCIFARYTDGRFVQGPSGRHLPPGADPRQVSWHWFSHLRAVRGHLWNRLQDENFVDENGSWYTAAADRFLLFPCLDMAGPERIVFLDQVLMFYNTSNSHHTNGQAELQRRCGRIARNLRRYDRL